MAILLTGCGVVQPDLVPGLAGANNAQCLDGGQLRVAVLNNGKSSAPSKTSVQFAHKQNPEVVDTPVVETKGSILILVPIPRPVPGDVVAYTITVDSAGDNDEFDETNNTAANLGCPIP